MIGRFAPVYMGNHWTMSQTEAVSIAHTFNLIVAQASVFPQYIGAMRSANPNVRILAYVNGMFDLTKGGTAYPLSWYAHDAKGNRVQSTFGNYLLNPANTNWPPTVAQQCSAAISRSHYDGCFLDTLGTAPLSPTYMTGVPINPATGKVWTIPQWINATSNVAKTVLTKNSSYIVMDNGLADGQKYYNPSGSTEPLIAATHLGMIELWLRSNGTPATGFPSESEWLQDINMEVNAQSQGFSIASTTKLWVNASSAQVSQWHAFTLASYLLADNGKDYYSFTPSQTDAGLLYDTSWDHVNIGTPTGAFSADSNGLYHRTFTNGIAAVNPTNNSVTFVLGASYINLAGKTVSSETLPPHSGEVFVK